jgi:DNA-directed RNA polymerase specialized sigma subunit
LVWFRYGLGGDPLSLTETALRLRVSPSSAKRLERAALAALRAMIDVPEPANQTG